MPRKLPRIHRWPRAFLDWLCAGRADYQAFQARRQTRRYCRMRGICKSIWIVAGLFMLAIPTAAFVIFVSLVATFLSFALLEESDYMQ